jgi:hypothetical protein
VTIGASTANGKPDIAGVDEVKIDSEPVALTALTRAMMYLPRCFRFVVKKSTPAITTEEGRVKPVFVLLLLPS